MITPDLNADGCTGNIIIEPNHPISWNDNVRFLKIFALVSFIIGIVFMQQGFLLVLPFSGLEVLLVAFALYIVFKHYSTCQVIYFTKDSIIIESGDTSPEHCIKYQRYWSKFHVEDKGGYHIPRLTIQSKGKTTEIGSFLGFDDKMKLIELIKKLTICFQSQSIA